VPIVVLVMILGKALAVAHQLVAPLAEHLPFESVIGLKTPMLLAPAVIVLLCFLAGFLARTALAQKAVGSLKTSVLSNLPGYELLKRVGASLLGIERSGAYPVVLARFDDTWQLGFEKERLENGLVAVFIPSAPQATAGEVHLLCSDRITSVPGTPALALKCLKRLGAGSNALLRGVAVPFAPGPSSSIPDLKQRICQTNPL
jgi:uncharacterized membrane protein